MIINMFKRFLFAVLVSLALAALQAQAQGQSGFISLDCGLQNGTNSSYTDPTSGIVYTSDDAYVETGVIRSISSEYQKGKEQQLWHVRSFPDGERNCYMFNLTKGNKYLIRAYFMYGNYDELGNLPQFDLYAGPNKWVTITLKNASTTLIRELIHVLPTSYFHVCLVYTGFGTPFINALEIRPLKNSTYVTESGSLSLFTRLDVASLTNQKVRYKDDVYDRIWNPYNSVGWGQLSTNLTIDANISNNFQPARVVMSTATYPENVNGSLDFFLDTVDASPQFYAYLHFAEVVPLPATEIREMNISVGGLHWYGPFTPNYLYTTTVYSTSALTGGNYTFSIQRTERATQPPILNALEAYSVVYFLQSQTNQNDYDAITNIKSMYGVKRNWQGDPCVPQAYLWEGLNCSYGNVSIPPNITSLNLSSSGLTGEIPRSISNLGSLQSLDLSNNSLNGSVPNFLSQLPLTYLNLKGNNFTGPLPVALLERSKNGSLTLSFDGQNPSLCSSGSCTSRKKSVVVPVVASVAGFIFLIGVALVIFLFLRRRQQVRKVETETDSRIETLESNNRQFSYSEILKITNNFQRILGKGGFGTVYYGRLSDGTEVAVKMISSETAGGFKQFQTEVKLLMRVHHRNLTSLVGYCDEDNKMALVYEFMANGNLLEHLSDADSTRKVLSWEERLRMAMESAQGLEYLHNGCKPPIVHRDVKSTNILLNEKFQAKLADFGLSKSFPTENDTHMSTVAAGTPGYLDPEYYATGNLTEKSDVYSFGVVLLEIITCRPAVARINEHEKIHVRDWVSSFVAKGDIMSIVDPRLQGEFSANSVWKAVEVAMACLAPTGRRRPSMSEVVMELSECLASEMARTHSGRGLDSSESVDGMMSMNLGGLINPGAR